MNILSIETSADETAVSIIKADGNFPHATYELLGNALYSQVKVHEEYGGIFPSVAKREHAKILTPLLHTALQEASLKKAAATSLSEEQKQVLAHVLERELDVLAPLTELFETVEKPPIDLIAVTSGPGLEPTLWVGVNFAKALATIWGIPVVPVNHMEGHTLVSLTQEIKNGNRKMEIAQVRFPALALLISGGHTEFDLMSDWLTYERIGSTRDDAVGEAFDKVARMMGLPYPGGPEIGRLARFAREQNLPQFLNLPKPMMHSDDLDFSFSGLKTAVRYGIEGKELSEEDKMALSRDLEDTIAEVLVAKTKKALDQTGAQSLIIGGGVSASQHLRDVYTELFENEYPDFTLYIPERKLSTDNSVMIALAGHARMQDTLPSIEATTIKADGNRSLSGN